MRGVAAVDSFFCNRGAQGDTQQCERAASRPLELISADEAVAVGTAPSPQHNLGRVSRLHRLPCDCDTLTVFDHM